MGSVFLFYFTEVLKIVCVHTACTWQTNIYKFSLISIPSKAVFPISPLLGRVLTSSDYTCEEYDALSICVHGHEGGDGRERALFFSQVFKLYPISSPLMCY